jgi:sugar phosphate permease
MIRPETSPQSSHEAAGVTLQRPTHVRHVVLFLTVLAYMITYMDRVVISAASPVIQKQLGVSMLAMGVVFSSFRWAYSIFQIPGGWLGDRIGPRKALTLIVSWWSLFTSFTALAWSVSSMAVIRFIFGMGEAGAFPIATRSLSRWMLPSERGYAQGVTHAGSRLGAAISPIPVVFLITMFGWHTPFFVFGSIGLCWAAVWLFYYRDSPEEHPGVNQAERDLIHNASGGARAAVGTSVPWARLLSSPAIWALSAMYFCYQYSLAVYVDWFPTYLTNGRGFSLKEMGFYTSVTLLAGMGGDLLGGWLTDFLLRRTKNINFSRRFVGALGFLLGTAGIIPATLTSDPRVCVAFSCLAFGALEMTVAVSWAIPLDIAGDFAGSAAAIMNMTGNIGGALSPVVLAYLVKAYGWNVPFLVAAALSILGALIYLRIDASKRVDLAA